LIVCIHGVLHLDVAVRAEDSVEREPREALRVHARNGAAVAGDADEPNEAFVTRLDSRLQRAALAQRLLPLDHVDQVVQLDQVDAVDTHALERAPDLRPRAVVVAAARLRREEEAVAVLCEPRLQAILRLAVRGGNVDVVDAVLEQELEHAVGLGLRHAPADRGGAEDRPRALVSGAAEQGRRDHLLSLPQT
jgi:hypothetical protein